VSGVGREKDGEGEGKWEKGGGEGGYHWAKEVQKEVQRQRVIAYAQWERIGGR